ncbi:MAG TPA: alkaline phosphatase family protein [Anaerolineales bacterium]
MLSNDSQAKIVAIGWDGATWDLLTRWVEAGKLPSLARLMQRGVHTTLQSTPLPLSPAAWSTIVTGQNPGKHGVFDWFERKSGEYQVEYVHTGRLRARPIWDYYTAQGKRIGIFNPPMIYPAAPVDGFMLSGMAAPSPHAAGFAYPAGLLSELESQVGPYVLGEREVYQYGREGAYLEGILDWLAYQRDAVRYLVKNHPCDAYLFVFMQPDHAQHKFWRYLSPQYPGYDPGHDGHYQDAIYKVYRALDDSLGELMAIFGEAANYLLLSDHGAGPNYGVMYINRWLQQAGLLRLKQSPSRRVKYWLARSDIVLRIYQLLARLGLGSIAQWVSKPARNRLLNAFISFDDVDWTRTRAYSRGAFGQIYLNLEGREPRGIVQPGEASEALIKEIMAALKQLRHPTSGEPLITNLHRRDEVLQGPYVQRAADVLFSILDYAYGSSVKMGLQGGDILGPSEYGDSGSHRPEGILVMAGPGIQSGSQVREASAADIAPTWLALAGLPLPTDLDGRVLEQALTPEVKAGLKYLDGEDEGRISGPGDLDLSSDEVAEIEARLRSLGYLG